MAAYDSWRFEVSSADPDAAVPNWVNLTSRVRTTGTGTRPVTIRRGAGSERDDVQPSTLTALLDNQDHALTPGNPTSPYVSWWGQRRKCRLVETMLGVDYVRFTGYTNPLDLPDWAEPGVEQLVTLTAVDWLGRLDAAPAFTSTLGEHIRTQGGNLVEWFPLWDPSAEQVTSYITEQIATRSAQGWAGAPIKAEPDELIQPGLGGPPGDDASYLRWAPVGDADGLSQFADAYLDAPVAVTPGLSDTIALSAWVQLQDYNMAPTSVEPQGFTVRLLRKSPTTILGLGKEFISGSTFYNGASVFHAGLGAVANLNAGRPYERHVWRLVTVRFTLSSGLLELYSGADVAVSTTVAAPAGPLTFDQMQAGLAWSGGIAHVQVRVGPAASTMTQAMHLAQYAHGYRGLERQTVVERISTLAGYAGVPTADLAMDAAAATPMQRARFARAKPTSAMRAAATTESGRLFVTGPGQIKLRPRAARYNQPVTMQVPYAWLSRGLRFREDSPINDVTVSQAGGSSTRRTDAASISRYGVGGDPVTLETAIDADLGNYASWTVGAYATPRMRCPQLVIDLLPLTDVQRAQLLGLEIGDRIQITGGPSTIPPEARHLIVEGFAPDEIGVETRRITLTTSPLLGPSAGTPPASVMVGDLVATTAIIAY